MGFSGRIFAAVAGLTLAVACGANKGPGNGLSGNGQGGSGASSSTASNFDPGFVDTIDPGDGDDSTVGKPGGGGDDENCGFQNYALERSPAELLLVLDRSGSMDQKVNNRAPATKWVEMTGALDETIKATDATVHWGLKMYPTSNVECQVQSGIDVAMAPGNYGMVTAAIGGTTPKGNGTPTRQAMHDAVMHAKLVTSPNPKYLVLATDGAPNCANDTDSNTDDEMGAIASVGEALTAGFPTFVIGIATANSDANVTLNSMAMAGGQPRAGATKYYAVNTRQELVDALAMITGLVASCDFPLTNDPPSPDDVAVNLNGVRVPRDTTQMMGWDYAAGGKSVRLFGSFCDEIKTADSADTKQVDIIFGCPGVIIP